MESRKDIALAFQRLVVSGQVREAYTLYIHPDFRHHNPYFPGDRESLLVAMEDNAKQFPDKVFDVVRIFEDGDFVVIHSRLQLAANKPRVAVVHIYRFEGDKIIEEWDVGQQVPDSSPNTNGMF